MRHAEQIRVRRPQLTKSLPVDEYIAHNADSIWLHQSEIWEYATTDEADYARRTVGCAIE